MKNKVGILGGTFDPIHIGHIAIAENAMKKCGLVKVILIPTGLPPHKELAHITSAEHRLQMAILAAEGIPFLSVSDMETKRSGYCYTVDTIKKLREAAPNLEYYYIIGADNIEYIKHWKDAKELLNGLEIICFSRDGFDMEKDGEILEKEYGAKIHYMQITIPISSTEIRMKLMQKEDVSQYLSEAVIAYIRENGLYGE